MSTRDELTFEVYVRTRSAVVTLVREASFREAYALARAQADSRGQPVFVRNTVTRAVETVGPSALALQRSI